MKNTMVETKKQIKWNNTIWNGGQGMKKGEQAVP